MSTNELLAVHRLVVMYRKHRALDELSLTLPQGATGLVGRNGAGKSTLLRVLLGLLRPKAGTGHIMGVDVQKLDRNIRSRIGYMPENEALVLGLSGLEQVVLAGELCGLSSRESARRAHEALAYTGLGEARYRQVHTFSAGMKQRLKLAVALVHDPELLLLDEPTVGLDPPGRRRMLDLIRDLAVNRNKSLVLSTHLLGDIEATCENIVILESGKVIGSGPIEGIKQHRPNRLVLEWNGHAEVFFSQLKNLGVTAAVETPASVTSHGLTHVTTPPGFDTAEIFQQAFETGVRIIRMEPEEEPLSELYHRLLHSGLNGSLRHADR
jgi:ABC-2 type transport system ATP-binding protein